MSRKNAFIRVSIGADFFQSGDGKLIDATVTLGEGQSLSSCSFSVRASTALVDKYFTTIYKNDGLDPVVIPSQKDDEDGSNSNPSSSYDGSIPSINGVDPTKIKQAINFYLGKGLSLEGAAYLVGNYIQESSLNHLADNGTGNVGLAQWDSSRRLTNGGIPFGSGDFTRQLNWALAEMVTDSTASGQNHNLRSKLNGTNVNAITAAISSWERYGGDEAGGRYAYGAQLLEALKKGGGKDKAKDSAIAAQNPIETKKTEVEKVASTQVFTGSQITIEKGFNGKVTAAYSFLHTSIEYNFNKRVLTFGGQAATWILTQRIKSTAYKDCTLQQIAKKICDAHGLNLEYKGDEIKYKYFPQLGITDYDCLFLECRRVGYRLHTEGATMTIAPRESRKPDEKIIGKVAEDKKQLADFALVYGENLTTFTVNHSAGSNSGGARSSSPSERESTGETKYELDPDTGKIEQTRKEDKTGAGTGSTGYHTATIKPLTDGDTDEKDKSRRESELRIKGITAEFSCPSDNSALLLTPDSIFQTFNISNFLDRVWTVEKVTHNWNAGGFSTTGSVYSPMKNKYPPAEKDEKGKKGNKSEPTDKKNPGGFIHPTAGKGYLSSPYGQRGGRLHAGVDVAPSPNDPLTLPIYASKDGSCNVQDNGSSGYGLNILINHNDGYWTLYAHLSAANVSNGETVKQGDNIGVMGSSGRVVPPGANGTHLHFNIYSGSPSEGSTVDPENFIKFK